MQLSQEEQSLINSSTHIEIYFEDQYITNIYHNKIRDIYHYKQAKKYIKDKYNWRRKFNDIE